MPDAEPLATSYQLSAISYQPSAISQIIAIVRKDIAAEVRTKEIFTAMFVFAVLSLVIFNFAFELRVESVAAIAPGALWVAITFAGVLGLNRCFVLEKDRGCLEGLLLCPVDRNVLYLGKMLSAVIFMAAMEVVTLPLFSVFFNLPILILPLLPVVALGTVGFAAVGTLFAAMSVNTRAREVLLPILLFPVLVPVLIGAVKASGAALAGNLADAADWLQLLATFDVIYLVIGLLAFEYVVEE